MADAYSNESIKKFKALDSKIRRSIQGKTFTDWDICFSLYSIHESQLYQVKGYRNILEYAQEEFDFKKTKVYDFLKIAGRFGARDADGELDGTLKTEYAFYDLSKLAAMADLKDMEIEWLGITEETPVREIKRLVKGFSERAEKKPEEKPLPPEPPGEPVKGPIPDKGESKKKDKPKPIALGYPIDISGIDFHSPCRTAVHARMQEAVREFTGEIIGHGKAGACHARLVLEISYDPEE